jgi:hypothetical protein
MRALIIVLVISLTIASPLLANDPIYVDDDALPDANQDGTMENPFDTIQKGIDAAKDGETVVVLSGTYLETIDFMGKSIKVTGFEPNLPADEILPYPVIDGNGKGPVVTFSNGEDQDTELSGFTITQGVFDMGSAILCIGSSPMISNCLIVGNRTSDPNFGAAVYCMDSNSIIENCTITDNDGAVLGASIYLVDCSVVISNTIIWGNAPEQIMVESGNDPVVVYCDVQGAWAGEGNIDKDPLFADAGFWVDPDDPNLIPIEPTDPDAIWVGGDYHLMSTQGRWDPILLSWVKDDLISPCVDAGDPNSDFSNEPEPNGKRINSGAYGGTNQASLSVLIEAPAGQYDLTISSYNGGSVTNPGEGEFTYDSNTVVAVEATPDDDFYFLKWAGTAVDAGKVENPLSASTSVIVDANYTLIADFAFFNHTITISSTAGGSVTNPGEGAFTYGGNLTIYIQATADDCYHFVKWTGSAVSGKPVDASDPSTSIVVDGDYNLVANFAINMYELTTNSTWGGCVIVPGEETKEYECGTVVNLVAMPYWGYHFVCWEGPVANPYCPWTTVTVTEDTEVTAVFACNWPWWGPPFGPPDGVDAD